MIAIDGSGLVLGRVASHISKKLLQGEEVHLANCEKLVLVGNPPNIIENYQQRRRLQHKGTPEFSPKWPKLPHLLVRRVIRGMLPWDSTRGQKAFKLLRVYSGNPKGLELKEFKEAKFASEARHITIRELCIYLGNNEKKF